jgi:hypothetical protein
MSDQNRPQLGDKPIGVWADDVYNRVQARLNEQKQAQDDQQAGNNTN